MDYPEYLTPELLAQALKDSLERENLLINEINKLKYQVYQLEESLTGLCESNNNDY